MTPKFVFCPAACSGGSGLLAPGYSISDYFCLLQALLDLPPSVVRSHILLQSGCLACGASSHPSQKPVFGFKNQITKFVISLWNKSPWILKSILRASPALSIWSLRHTLSRLFFFFLTCFLFPCYFLNKWNYEVLHLIGRILHIYPDVSFGGTL